jgi:hypothetical protein
MSSDRARKILLEAFWTSEGWRRAPALDPHEFALAKIAGVMFHPTTLSHAEAVERAMTASARFLPREVAHAFVASLSTRRVELRSAFGSFAIGRGLSVHEAVPAPGAGVTCGVCSEYVRDQMIDWNVLNFERVKWGGVRHECPSYIAFDLTMFERLEERVPTADDWAILHEMLDLARSQAPDARPADLEKALSKVLRSNQSERRVLLQILGYAGILRSSESPSYLEHFVASTQRVSHTEWAYPFSLWRGREGVYEEAVGFWFPELVT